MRIFFCELYKLLSKKIFIICLVVALCINAFTLIYSSAENYNDRTKHNNIEYYNSLIKNCNSSKKAIYKLRQQVQSSDNLLFETALHFLQMYCCLHITQHPLDAENPGVFVVYYYKQNYRVLQIWKRTIDYPPLFAYYL